MAGSIYNTVFGSGNTSNPVPVFNGIVFQGAGTITNAGNTSFLDGSVINTGVTNGLIFGGNTNQKMGEFGVTAVIQPASKGELLGMNGNAATNANAVNMNSNGNVGNNAYTLSDVVKALKQMGGLLQ